ncbi:hypothetical protein B0186_02675 [Canicola haemoglobinophilus]|uniref:Uncharacterized conserved protein n=1 Tax=Canicola haemoglobinophilus TaxID=733 RepID=A0A1V4B2X4_9PAST|nr:DUF5655 domain-containing protein [Canicola haemoglobinophilus]OOS01621.1 hypothetical protein B0186_02675 [Canicola haemoglobinophilus]STO55585.1 Uncharacterized conserved protein [Canicola haemoglobinophilus]STO58923.1 Uncharacterized conserved protein [Canicola haemoglobinophilus]STO67911.1 Uncharacterized conserved protein [Canicola haemoglobinophilus]
MTRLFQYSKKQLLDLNEKPFKLEREIQDLFEQNLNQLTGLELVKSEFSIQNQRIDTLAFDLESKSFVIIEYKRSHNYSVFDQGVSYLNTLLRYQADFVLEYNESLDKKLRKDQVDWSQSKVVFVSPKFNNHQKQAVDFKDLNIELWEIKRFEQDIILINGIDKSSSAPSVKLSSSEKNLALSEISKEIKTYLEQDHLQDQPEEIIELYDDFKQALLNLFPEFNIVAQKLYVAFKNDKRNILGICINRKSLKIYLNMKKGALDDPKKLARDVSSVGHWGTGDYEITMSDDKNLEYIISLVKQAL